MFDPIKSVNITFRQNLAKSIKKLKELFEEQYLKK